MAKINLSIITCTLNSDKFLSNLLESVISQTSFPKEHIFIDGFSTDKTLDLISAYSAKLSSEIEVKVLNQKPIGISSAMNLGANLASGNYLWFLHSDDELAHYNSVRSVLAEIETNDSEWLIGGCERINSEGLVIGSFLKPKDHFHELTQYNTIPHPSTIVSKRVFEQAGGFDPKLKFAMDYDLWLKLKNLITPTFTSEILTHFREHDSSLSYSRPLLTHAEDFIVRLRHASSVIGKLKALMRFLVLSIFIIFPKTKCLIKKYR